MPRCSPGARSAFRQTTRPSLFWYRSLRPGVRVTLANVPSRKLGFTTKSSPPLAWIASEHVVTERSGRGAVFRPPGRSRRRRRRQPELLGQFLSLVRGRRSRESAYQTFVRGVHPPPDVGGRPATRRKGDACALQIDHREPAGLAARERDRRKLRVRQRCRSSIFRSRSSSPSPLETKYP